MIRFHYYNAYWEWYWLIDDVVLEFSTCNTNLTLDSDNDGMPDIWETAHNLDPNDNNDALLDSDNDGTSNRDEYIADTNRKAVTVSYAFQTLIIKTTTRSISNSHQV